MLKILIVEDEPPIAHLIRLNLSDEGYFCTCAFDGKQAADNIEREIYDLILGTSIIHYRLGLLLRF